MEDYHVDRPDVEALRSVKLTGTNNPIGLIVPLQNALVLEREAIAQRKYAALK